MSRVWEYELKSALPLEGLADNTNCSIYILNFSDNSFSNGGKKGQTFQNKELISVCNIALGKLTASD